MSRLILVMAFVGAGSIAAWSFMLDPAKAPDPQKARSEYCRMLSALKKLGCDVHVISTH